MDRQPSLADRAVSVLALVDAMDRDTNNDRPERHAVRSMKRMAEQILADAFTKAADLAWQAKDLRKLADDMATGNA